MIMILRLLVVLGFVFLSAQMVAGETPAPATGQVTQIGQPVPDKAKLSKRNQAMIEQAEAKKIRNNNMKSKPAKHYLSKTNKAKIRQIEAAKKRRDLIEKNNADSVAK